VGPSNEAKNKEVEYITLTPFLFFLFCQTLQGVMRIIIKSHLLVGKLLHLGFWIEAKGGI
jgi:hypothetical protein